VKNDFVQAIEERFIRYVRFDTQSDESSEAIPSTPGQLELLNLLRDELGVIGAEDVVLTDYGCVLGTIPATAPAASDTTVAFLAHVDTASEMSGSGVRPVVHRHYSGGCVPLPDAPERVLTPDAYPALANKIGEDIVTASGTTLLGADDKAGIAIIMTLATHLIQHPEIPHGTLRIAFTPDEEIGRGVDFLTPDALGADVAYTLDGGECGEICYETFSADKALVRIAGVPIHPGSAKGKLVNALHLAARFVSCLPQGTRTPETTEEREGYIHLYRMTGSVAEAELHFILRDFELDGLEAHGELLQAIARAIALTESRAQITCTITPQYRNMRYWLERDMRAAHLAIEAIEQSGITPIIRAARGGTDGSRLTEKGIPTPNLFTGTHNAHSALEWVSLQDMARAVEVCIRLVQLWAHNGSEDTSTQTTGL